MNENDYDIIAKSFFIGSIIFFLIGLFYWIVFLSDFEHFLLLSITYLVMMIFGLIFQNKKVEINTENIKELQRLVKEINEDHNGNDCEEI